jgi:mannitol operon repressor
MIGYVPEADNLHRFQIVGEKKDDYADIEAVISELNAESDRGAVIVGLAFIEERLKLILTTYAQDESAMGKALAGLRVSNVVEVCLGLGLISKHESSTYKILSSIRNKFAHRSVISFEDSEIRGLCDSLNFADWGGKVKPTPRDRFLANTFVLLMEMEDRPKFFRSNPRPTITIRRTIVYSPM